MGMTKQSEGAQVFEIGNKATVMRGKHRGKIAEILTTPDMDGQYAVKLDDGTLDIQNAANLKAPAEGTIGAGKLAAEISTAVGDMNAIPGVGQQAQDVLQALVSRLEREIPGLGGRISWPAQVNEG